MPETYFFESFISGLKPAVKPLVRAFNPQTLSSAIEHARYQEEHLLALKLPAEKPYKPSYPYTNTPQKGLLPTPNTTPLLPQKPFPSLPKTQNPYNHQRNPFPSSQNPPKFVPAAERAEKIAKGLCFLCDQPYERGHKCASKGKRLFLVEVLGEEEEAQEEMEEEETGSVEEEIAPRLSFSAMNGSSSFQTMRVNGQWGKRVLHILVDSGSTYNFMDEHLALQLGCQLQPMAKQAVAIPDGTSMQCQYVCRIFKWILQGIEFESDVLLLPLGSCHLVLEYNGYPPWEPLNRISNN